MEYSIVTRSQYGFGTSNIVSNVLAVRTKENYSSLFSELGVLEHFLLLWFTPGDYRKSGKEMSDIEFRCAEGKMRFFVLQLSYH